VFAVIASLVLSVGVVVLVLPEVQDNPKIMYVLSIVVMIVGHGNHDPTAGALMVSWLVLFLVIYFGWRILRPPDRRGPTHRTEVDGTRG